MPTVFDSSAYPTLEPSTLTAGDFWAWKLALSDYPASLYDLRYDFQSHGVGTEKQSLSAVASGDDFHVTVTSTASRKWVPAEYAWAATIIQKADVSLTAVLRRGVIRILPDPTVVGDSRTANRKMLDLIDDVLHGRASTEMVNSISFGGKTFGMLSPKEILEVRAYYADRVEEEDNERLAKLGVYVEDRVIGVAL